jgi:hypothetical protein
MGKVRAIGEKGDREIFTDTRIVIFALKSRLMGCPALFFY